MKKRYASGLVMTVVASSMLIGASSALAAHPAVPLLKSDGTPVGQHDAYSPRTTCGACHDQSTAMVDSGTPGTNGAPGSYDGGGSTKQVVKTQGVMNETTGEVEWVSYNVTAYEHGFVVGRHSQQGRNEDYGNHLRHAVHGKFWASSPGMFGKY